MSKETQLLKSKLEFYKRIINELDNCNFITKSNRFDNQIEKYQNELTKLYKEYQELKKECN